MYVLFVICDAARKRFQGARGEGGRRRDERSRAGVVVFRALIKSLQ